MSRVQVKASRYPPARKGGNVNEFSDTQVRGEGTEMMWDGRSFCRED